MKDECYEFIKGQNNKISIVGFGSYGEVKLAKNSETGEIVAIKMIHGRNAKEEIDVHHKLNHPNIITLINYYYEKDKNMTYMVLEFADNGSLHDKIKFGYGQLPKHKIKRYFRDVCKAVHYLHSLKYMHRDIKPENILITKNDHCKLCDFGFAAILEYRSTLCGTYEYMAPEMIQQKPYDYKVDIWALGILLFELIQGSAPFRGETGQDVIGEMKKPIVFSNRFEKEEIELIKTILRVGAEKRPDVSVILQNPYFRDMEEYDAEQRQIQKMWQMDQEKMVDGTSGSKFSTAQTSRTGSSWSNHQQSKIEKPSRNGQRAENKQFKYFVPQGVKTNPILGSNKVGYTGTPNQFQNFNNSSSGQFLNSSNSNPPTANLNSSSSSGYRANLLTPGSYNVPTNKGLPSTVQLQPRSQPPVYPPSYQANGYQSPMYHQQQPGTSQLGTSQPGISQGQWRKQ